MHDDVALHLFVRPDWYDRANCSGVGPAPFFVERGVSTAAASAMCDACEVQVECLFFAVDMTEPYGVWGGMSPRERSAIRTRRRRVRT